MESCEKIVSDFAEKNNCSIDEAKSQIDLLIKESRQTNLGISNAIKSNGYISFPNGLTIGKYGKNGELNSKYLCYTPNIKKIIEMDKKDVAIVSGFGATNSPTIGTLSMMIKLIELQKNTGFYTYVIINDLGSINARRLDPKYVIRLTDHFKDFLLKLGFDEKNGEIRTHNDLDHSRTFSLVASTIKINDFSTNTEATDDTYNRLKLRGNDFSAMIDHVYTATDVLLPILKDKKKGIIVPCGLEEFYHANIGGIALERMKKSGLYDDFIPEDVEIGALYSKLIDGFYPYFKQSKSIENASLYLGDSKKIIKDKIMSCLDCNERVIIQMIEQGTDWTDEEKKLALMAFDNRLENNDLWKSVKQKFCDWFISVKDIWDSYKENEKTNLTDLIYKEK